MKILYVPGQDEHEHVCEGLSRRRTSHSDWWFSNDDEGLRRYPEGTVRSCSCGKTWVAGKVTGMMTNVWRRETRFERWRRERRSRKLVLKRVQKLRTLERKLR